MIRLRKGGIVREVENEAEAARYELLGYEKEELSDVEVEKKDKKGKGAPKGDS